MPRQEAVGWVRRLRPTVGSTAASPAQRQIRSEHPARRRPPFTHHLKRTQGRGTMLQCQKAGEVDRTPGPRLNYSELRAIAKEGGLTRHLGKILERSTQDKKRRSRKLSKSSAESVVNGVNSGGPSALCSGEPQRHDVFLGGSCNPTTWRRDVAIPLLESLNITYYNPQVSEWHSGLVAVERRAKTTARVLLYVLDRSTRNVVGAVEAANFAAADRRRLVLVIGRYARGRPVAGETISDREFEELCNGMSTLKDIVVRQGIPVFQDISEAIKCTSTLLSSQEKVSLSKVHSLPDKLDQIQVGHKHLALKEAFDALDKNGSGEITLKDCCMAYKWLTNNSLSINDLNGLFEHPNKNEINGHKNGSQVTLNFSQFCEVVPKLRLRNGTSQTWLSPSLETKQQSELILDLYIGGIESVNDDIKNLLEHSGLKYRIGSSWNQWASQEADVMESAKLLLLIVPSSSRALDTMAIASYYIGLGCNMILCIEDLTEGSIIKGEKLSKVACNDYNRGRVYLRDEAQRTAGVKVTNDLKEAVTCALERLT